MLKDKKIGILMGGWSPEREISLRTGRAVEKVLGEAGYKVLAFDLQPFSLTETMQKIVKKGIEVIFLALHGPGGEDGCIQGLLELMEIPYTGSGVLASALAMNKHLSKKIFASQGILTPRCQLFSFQDRNRKIFLPLPVVVKPNGQGSALGVSIAEQPEEIEKALNLAFKYDQWVLVEEYIAGKEISVAILEGNPLPVIEIVPKTRFYDYEAKYSSGMSDHIIPARLPEEQQHQAQEIARAAFHSLGCEGVARVDLIVAPGGEIYVLEINTIPGMTETSLLPEAARAAGISFLNLVEKLLENALQRSRKECVIIGEKEGFTKIQQ